MGEFFRGWKRKTGVVTLSMACMLMVCWVRSQQISDFVKYRIGPQHWFFMRSNRSRFELSIMKEYQPGQFTYFRMCDSSPVDKVTEIDRNIQEYEQGFSFCAFNIGRDDGQAPRAGLMMSNPPKRYFGRAPYWPIVVSLTAFSAWLFLAKPRERKSKSTIRPIPETAG